MARGKNKSGEEISALVKQGIARKSDKRRSFSAHHKLSLMQEFKNSGICASSFEKLNKLSCGWIHKALRKQDVLKLCAPSSGAAITTPHTALELRLMEWVLSVTKWRGFRLSAKMIQQKARTIAGVLHIPAEKFAASNGWYANFKKRNNLVTISLHGERSSADLDAARAFPPILAALKEKLLIDADMVCNADESLLFYRRQLLRTVVPADVRDVVRGRTQDKSRVGVMFACYSDGTLVDPFIIGTALLPREMSDAAFPAVHKAECPIVRPGCGVFYSRTSNGWLNAQQFVFWLMRIFIPSVIARCEELHRTPRSLLLMDNCSSHYTALLDLWAECRAQCPPHIDGEAVVINATAWKPSAYFRNEAEPRPARDQVAERVIRELRAHGADVRGPQGSRVFVRGLPPRTTSLIQPCDQGLIAAVKARWRSYLDEGVVASATSAEAKRFLDKSVADVAKKLGEITRTLTKAQVKKYWAPLLEGKDFVAQEMNKIEKAEADVLAKKELIAIDP